MEAVAESVEEAVRESAPAVQDAAAQPEAVEQPQPVQEAAAAPEWVKRKI